MRREGDVLKFERRATGRGLQGLEGPDTFTLPVSEIRSLDVWTPSVGTTVLGLTVVGLVILTGWVLTEFSRYDNSAM